MVDTGALAHCSHSYLHGVLNVPKDRICRSEQDRVLGAGMRLQKTQSEYSTQKWKRPWPSFHWDLRNTEAAGALACHLKYTEALELELSG